MSNFSNYKSETTLLYSVGTQYILLSVPKWITVPQGEGRQQFERQLAFTPSMLI